MGALDVCGGCGASGNLKVAFGTWCKYLTTTFLISTSSDLNTVSDRCVSHLDGNDAMIITKVTKPIKGWLSQKQWDWISENLQ